MKSDFTYNKFSKLWVVMKRNSLNALILKI